MTPLTNNLYPECGSSPQALTGKSAYLMKDQSRRDRWVTAAIIAVALVIALGLMVAWWVVCQSKGMYPALDMPAFSQGGTWKVYCTT